jgi:alpha-glucosidase
MKLGIAVAAALTALGSSALSQPAPVLPGPHSIVPLSNGAEVNNGTATIRVTALTDSILRVRATPGRTFPEDASWAVPTLARSTRVAVRPLAGGFETAAVAVAIDPKSLALTVSDRQGRTIHADTANAVRFDGPSFTLRKTMPTGESYYALGDKTGPFNRRGASYVNWTTDAWGFDRGADPIYKSITFYVATGGDGGAYGLFLDNTWRTAFDFGHREEGTLAISADGGPIDYYIIAGPTVADVVRRYTDLTGKTPMPPRWALGFQQSRYSYMSEAEVREIANRLRSERIPSDVIWLDIDFQDRNRPFTTNPTTFPDLKGLARDVGSQGFKLVTITDLHVANAPDQVYEPYESGVSGNHFLKKPDGSTYVAPVWPGPSVFPDFTRQASRDWWGRLYKDFVDDGIAGFWNDMNEPAIFETPTKTMPLDTVHRIESDDFKPRIASHAEVHNVYGMENSRATFEGLLKLRPNVRPFVMTRATFAGGQRYAVNWTGDNSSTWDHLKLAVQQMLNLGLSGHAWSGADVAGFIGGASPELMTRWYEIAAFTPIFRSHAANNAPRAEPWVDGPEHLAIRKRFIEARYRLLPYLYSVAEQTSRTGDPIMRPVFYDYPAMAKAPCDQSMAFTVGRDLLVAPAPNPTAPQAYEVCLPSSGWYDYWNGHRIDGERVTEPNVLARLPVYVRAGAILARQPVTQSTSELPTGPLSIDVYSGPDCRGELYWDDGVSIRGKSLRQTIRCTQGKDGLMVHFDKRVGRYKPWWKAVEVTVHGWAGPVRVRANGRTIPATTDENAKVAAFLLPDPSRATDIAISRF